MPWYVDSRDEGPKAWPWRKPERSERLRGNLRGCGFGNAREMKPLGEEDRLSKRRRKERAALKKILVGRAAVPLRRGPGVALASRMGEGGRELMRRRKGLA